MFQITKMETRFQEIVFLLTFTSSMSLLIAGVFYLTVSPGFIVSLLGDFGGKGITSLFNTFGYAFFMIPFLLIHLGDLVLLRCLYVADFLRMQKQLVKIAVVHSLVLLIVSSFLSVWQAYLQLPSSVNMTAGMGGNLGALFGGNLYLNIGLFGSIVVLFLMLAILFISFGVMEVVSSVFVMKDLTVDMSSRIFRGGKSSVNGMGSFLREFADGYSTFSEELPRRQLASSSPGVGTTEQRNLGSNGMYTDHFHVYRSPLSIPTQEIEKSSDQKLQESFEMPKMPLETLAQPKSRKATKQIEAEVEETEEPSVAKKVRKSRKKSAKNIQVNNAEGVSEEVTTDEESTEAVNAVEDLIVVKAFTKRYKKPDTGLLNKATKKQMPKKQETDAQCQLLEERLESFGIKGKIVAAHVGVTLTMFEFKPDAGVKLSKIANLADDLALILGAPSIRLLTPIPGKATVGIEVPNSVKSPVAFSELVTQSLKKAKTMALPVPLGKDVYDNIHLADVAAMPHLLISGTTGSGKSVFMNNLISSLIYSKSPKELRFLMIDPKMIELSPYNGIPHLLKPVVTDVEEAKHLLMWAEKEMDRRYQQFSDMQTRNIESYNKAIKKTSKRAIEGRLGKKIEWDTNEMPFIVIVIDELADLMLTQGKDVEIPITRIAQKARAAGIHLIVATQRPSAEIVTGLIKTNFPTRISFKVSSAIDSRTILDTSGAEKLLGLGDMLFQAQGAPIKRMQGAYLSEDEVKKIVKFTSKQ